MASQSDVDRTIRDLLQRLETAGGGATRDVDLPAGRTIACVVPDIGVTYTATYEDGAVRDLEQADGVARGDITFRVKSDDLIALAQGRLNLMLAVMTGRLRVDAGARDLALLRRMF